MFNVESHKAFGPMKKILSGISSANFPAFISFVNYRADAKASNWKTDTDNYGFSTFESKFKVNGVFYEELFKHTIRTKIVGDALEMFAGFFCQWFETDIEIGVKRGTWEFTSDGRDLGCDAVGVLGTNGAKCFTQVKYRSNPNDKPFDLEVFCKLFTQATISYGMDYSDSSQRLMFFTNIPFKKADKAAARTLPFISMANDCKVPVVLIGKNEIESKVGGKNLTNVEFWKAFNGMFN